MIRENYKTLQARTENYVEVEKDKSELPIMSYFILKVSIANSGVLEIPQFKITQPHAKRFIFDNTLVYR